LEQFSDQIESEAALVKEHIMSRLQGKTAVVTGGGSGIGLGAAKRFIDEGAFVYLFGRRQEALNAAVAQLGPNARAVSGSVTDLADLDRLYETVKAERGGLDILFANAGTGSFAPLGEITPEHYDQIFDVNVKGLIFTVQKALPLMTAGVVDHPDRFEHGCDGDAGSSASTARPRRRSATWRAAGRWTCAAPASA
jgi:NAD(P)-dependent dehydrogenase (short-subunit alcohol dehydrogenase family)